ncbi:MAG TPA: CPXCG motif-containing cysteine-rich protein [Salinisphaeraceae bacterium]|nr:CPXCG motif-containing cysteine-rich protein [Salinisphaeraceae bacterium]
MLEEERTVTCPYCYEPTSLLIDCTAGSQTYVEDCGVCCQPMLVKVTLTPNGEITSLEVEAENR